MLPACVAGSFWTFIRLAELASRIQNGQESLKVGKQISYGRICAWGAMKWGCRFRTMDEYLSVLEEAGLIGVERENDLVRWL